MSKVYQIAVLSGDGIGPEVIAEAIQVLEAVADVSGFSFEWQYAPVGGAALAEGQDALPDSTLETCLASNAVLLGAIGDPRFDSLPGDRRPERGLLKLRQELGLYANLRPARVYPGLVSASTLKEDVVKSTDLLIVRELTGGIYFGSPRHTDGTTALNTMIYTRQEVERIAHIAFRAAENRSGRLTSVDKANVLEVSQLWRQVVSDIHQEYPDVELSHMYVDNAAMQLIRNPEQFDVILTGNMFGDILSDEAAMITGSLGMLPSASLGDSHSLYEPVHGSAPDLAGRGKANPIATIASAGMMLRHTFALHREADALEQAIAATLHSGARTADLANQGDTSLSTREMGTRIAHTVHSILTGQQND